MSERIRLTEERVRTLQPPATGETVLWDSEVSGFGLRCYPSGRKVFILYYRANGGGRAAPKRRMTIGEAGSVKLADARGAAQQYLGQIAAGGDPQAQRKEAARRQAARLDKALEAYEQYLAGRQVVNQKHILSLLRRELLRPLGKVDLAAIDRQKIADRVTRLEDQLQPGAAQDLRAKATTFLNWAVNRGLIYANPLAGWRRERATRAQITARRGKALASGEIKALWRACGAVSAPFGDYVRILLLLGQRRKETAHMRWCDLDLENGAWTIPAAHAKNGRGHRVPLPPFALTIIRRQPRWAECPYVFAGRGGKPMSGWSKHQASLIAKSGVKFTLHDCRRTFRSGLRLVGMDSELAELMLNHARADLIERYDREPRLEERSRAATAWADHVAGLVGRQGSGAEVVELAVRASA
jgi:integrase